MHIKLTGNLKTYEAWDSDWDKYFQLGDYVDDEMWDYALEVLPPQYWKSDLLQIGEPHDHGGENGKARYSTFQKHGSQWVYTGNHVTGERVKLI